MDTLVCISFGHQSSSSDAVSVHSPHQYLQQNPFIDIQSEELTSEVRHDRPALVAASNKP